MITFDMNVCLELRWDGQQGRRISVFIFSGGDYILLSKTVILKWNHRMKNYYINKGYHLTNIGDEFEVNVSDLTDNSNVLVAVRCDYCGCTYSTQYSSYRRTNKNGKNACRKCSSLKVKETNLEKYGVENVFQLDTIKEKSKNTIKDRYGAENVSQSETVQQKKRKRNLKKYGVTNPSMLDSVKEKVKQSNRDRFGVDYPMQLTEFQERIKQTDIKKYGVPHHVMAPDVIAKRKRTNLKRYGVEFPIQNEEILHKSISSRYQHGSFTCSKQQYKLYEIIGGELNYPFKNFVIDIAFPDEKIAVEWDGSGHDLSVRMGYVTEKEFNRNENYRNVTLFNNDWKIIRFITKKDIFPDNIPSLFNYCKSYIDDGGHKITVFIDENKIHFKDQYIEFNNVA